MKKSNKLVLILALVLTLVFPTAAFGEDIVDETPEVDQTVDTVDESTEEESTSEESEEDVDLEEDEELEEDLEEGKGNGKNKLWKEAKAQVQLEKTEIEVLKDEVDAEIEELELQLEALEAAGDEAAAAELKLQLEVLKAEKDEYKIQMKAKIAEMQQIMKDKYSLEELSELEEVAETLENIEGVEVIPVENVLIGKGNAKFDTPPVIKHGRTLIPVRAVSEAMGAIVEWNDEEKVVTITKDDTIIKFNLSENKVYVGEAEVALDVPAEVMNNRTMVPLRFIAEQLGLNVEWDEELGTIEIE